jgi:hypothetical protein
MNVNPFSYLIEKLKSKVSKSGDTMTGDLTVDTGTSTDSVVVIGGSQNYGALRLKAGTTGKQGTIITAALTANRNYILPDKGGTVALENLTDLTITLNTNVLYDNNTKVYGVKFGNIAIITGILMVKGAVSRNDVLFTISGFTPTQLTYCTATKTTANKSFLMRFDANGTQAVVDETPATATSNWDFFGFNMVLYHK